MRARRRWLGPVLVLTTATLCLAGCTIASPPVQQTSETAPTTAPPCPSRRLRRSAAAPDHPSNPRRLLFFSGAGEAPHPYPYQCFTIDVQSK